MYYANEQRAWKYLLNKATEAHEFAVASQMDVLAYRANEFMAYAYQGLGDVAKAKETGLKNLELSKQYKVPDAVARWQAFLVGL